MGLSAMGEEYPHRIILWLLTTDYLWLYCDLRKHETDRYLIKPLPHGYAFADYLASAARAMIPILVTALGYLLLPAPGWTGQSFLFPVCQVVRVRAGGYGFYKFNLRQGNMFSAKRLVSYGISNIGDVFLLNNDNFVLYAAGQPFFHYGNSGLVQGASYSVAIPESGLYYFAVDNRRAPMPAMTMDIRICVVGQ